MNYLEATDDRGGVYPPLQHQLHDLANLSSYHQLPPGGGGQHQNYMASNVSNMTSENSLEQLLFINRKIINVLQDEMALLWIIFGTIGNLLSLMVLLRKKMRIHSTFTYLTLLALCDTCVLYFGLLRDYLVNNYKINVDGVLFCKMHVFFFYFVLHMASWLLVAVNIDRLIAASFLSLSKKWCTPRTALTVSFYIAIGVFLVNSHFIYFVDSNVVRSTPLNAATTTGTPHQMLSTSFVATSTTTTLKSVLNSTSVYAMHRGRSDSRHGNGTGSMLPRNVNSNSRNGDDAGQYTEVLHQPINPYVYEKCWIKPNNPLYTSFFQVTFLVS
jgi:hypothetical protein